MFLAASYCFLGILMFFHNVSVYLSRLPFQLFRLRVPGRAQNPLVCCFVIESFLARSSAATKWRRAVFVAPLLSASALLFFGPRMSHAFPFIALCMWFTPTDPLDRLCGWLVFDGDRIKEHRVWTRLIVPCLDALG